MLKNFIFGHQKLIKTIKKMRKLFLSLTALALVFASCENDKSSEQNPELDALALTFTKDCATMDALEMNLAKDPTLANRMDAIEAHTLEAIKGGATARLAADGVIEIPVVFHVIYRTSSENIPT